MISGIASTKHIISHRLRQNGLLIISVITFVVGLLLCTPFFLGVRYAHWDDAYIFFRYATNLIEGQELAFNPGEPSVGVTSILWVFLLGLLRVVFGPTLPFTSKILGALLFSISASLWAVMVTHWTSRSWVGIMAGLLIAANPLGITLAVSGMDTALSLFVISWIFFFYSKYKYHKPIGLGLLLGLFILVRPDSVIFLLVVAVFTLSGVFTLIRNTGVIAALLGIVKRVSLILVSAVFISAPWLFFVNYHTGYIFPPTGIGKLLERLPAEHGITYSQFLALGVESRIKLAMENIIALFNFKQGGISILPFFLVLALGMPFMTLSQRERKILSNGGHILPVLWFYSVSVILTFSFLFPLPMPRYIATIIPTCIVGSLLLCCHLLVPKLEEIAGNLRSTTSRTLASVFVGLSFLGMIILPNYVTYRLYVPHARTQDVRRIIGEWFRINTPKDSTVALEPIGAIGFYSERKIVDMGGLINSGIWKHIEDGYGDPSRIFEFLCKYRPDYLVDRPPEKPWSVQRTIHEYNDHFELLVIIGSEEDAHLIYKLHW